MMPQGSKIWVSTAKKEVSLEKMICNERLASELTILRTCYLRPLEFKALFIGN